jgi:proteasome lid subunit RPN8/RPN11
MLKIKDELLRKIYSQAEYTYPNECCGILIGRKSGEKTGKEKQVHCIYPVNNCADKDCRAERFEICPDAFLYAELIAAKKGLEIVGIYHSHNDCEAYASEEDEKYALADTSYVIASVYGGKAADIRSWCREGYDGKFENEMLVKT